MSASSHEPSTLTVSIVVYRSALPVLRATVESLLYAIDIAREAGPLGTAAIDLVHNAEASADFTALSDALADQAQGLSIRFRLLEGHGNVGYGRGHNLSVAQAASDYHLILNPDVTLAPDSLLQGLLFLLDNPAVAGASPAVEDGEGRRQYVCKRYPSVLDLLLRGFAPARVKHLFRARLAHYEMQDLPETSPSVNIPIISGCFMLFRTEVLHRVGGFDEAYFLYFEDFDLSLRVHAYGLLAYVPAMHIVHLGGHSARKGLRHIGMFARSGMRFYRTHGWRLL